jgi:hypothetical protein
MAPADTEGVTLNRGSNPALARFLSLFVVQSRGGQVMQRWQVIKKKYQPPNAVHCPTAPMRHSPARSLPKSPRRRTESKGAPFPASTVSVAVFDRLLCFCTTLASLGMGFATTALVTS